eukprot:3588589-Rhodomonas_salina.2
MGAAWLSGWRCMLYTLAAAPARVSRAHVKDKHGPLESAAKKQPEDHGGIPIEVTLTCVPRQALFQCAQTCILSMHNKGSGEIRVTHHHLARFDKGCSHYALTPACIRQHNWPESGD